MIKKIRSGGQTGADQGGLAAGFALGIPTGGWIPKGCMTEYGPNPELVTKYGCVEHTSIRYPPRTRGNVRDSDGTAWFGRTGSPGYRCTYTATKDYRKPFRVITSAETLRTFIEEFNIRELNVAGNRESVNPGIRDSTIKIITEGLSK